MNDIGGNIWMQIQKKTGSTKNAISEQVPTWADVQKIWGWLDMMTGTSGYSTYSAKIQESTDVFLADYVPLAPGVTAETARAVIDGQIYDIKYIDNPMGMNAQLEFFLKYTGGQ